MDDWDTLQFPLRKRISRRTPASVVLCLPLFFLPLALAADHFDAASVKLAEMPRPIRSHSPGRIRYEGIGYTDLIRRAFALPMHLVVFPDWVWGVPLDHVPKEKLVSRYFTIDATMPRETTEAEFQLMLQNLLVERFGLAFHKETRQLARYELSFAEGGPKMPKAKSVPDGPTPNIPDDSENLAVMKHQNGNQLAFGEFGMRVKGDYTMAGIAELFSNYLQHPLVDRTGSTEYYDLNLTWGWNPYSVPPVPGVMNRSSNGEARELFSEMEKKLGLKVTLRSVPAEFVVIDRLRHEATEN